MSSKQDFTDNSMLELFRAEVDSHTQAMSEGLLALEKDPTQLKRIEPLMRAAHSIKGAARIVGIEDGVRVSHVMEDCFVAAQSGKLVLTSETIDSLLRGVDALIRIGSSDQDNPSEQELNSLVQEIQSAQQGKPRSAPKPAVATPPALLQQSNLESPPKSGASTIPVLVDGTNTTIGLPMNLDARGAEQIRQIVVEQRANGSKTFHLDLSQVVDISLEGLSLLACLNRPGQLEKLHLCNAPALLQPLLTHTGLGMDGV